jgi:hypothetical protein
MNSLRLPHSIEAEKAIICSILLDANTFFELDGLQADDFYSPKHQKVFSAISEMIGAGLEIDIITLTNHFREKGGLNELGGAAYIAGLTDVPLSLNPAYYADIIKQHSVKRRAIMAFNEGTKQLQSANGNAAEVLKQIQDELASLSISTLSNKYTFPPLKPIDTQAATRITVEPPELDDLLLYKGLPLKKKKTVTAIFSTGGVGKSYLLSHFGCAFSAGQSYGDISPVKPLRVLLLFGEDPQEIVDSRLYKISGGKFSNNLFASSVVGICGAIVGNLQNPERTIWFQWLEQTIENHMPLDLLVLDPMSRFYGLKENENEHQTFWIHALEYLTNKYGISIIFAHHVPKAEYGKISRSMGRGGGALVDGARLNFGMAPMTEETAARYMVQNPKRYIEFGTIKSNYTPEIQDHIILERGEYGLLSPVNIFSDYKRQVETRMLELFQEYTLSRREIGRKEGKVFRSELNADFPQLSLNQIQLIVDDMLNKGVLNIVNGGSGNNPKMIIQAV